MLLQTDIPEPSFDRGQCLIVAVLKVAGHGRWICVEHVLHTERNSSIVKPPLPVVAAVLSRGHRDDILFLAILHLHVFAAILGIARHLRRGRRVIKRIIQDQVERRPIRDFPRMRTVLASSPAGSVRICRDRSRRLGLRCSAVVSSD